MATSQRKIRPSRRPAPDGRAQRDERPGPFEQGQTTREDGVSGRVWPPRAGAYRAFEPDAGGPPGGGRSEGANRSRPNQEPVASPPARPPAGRRKARLVLLPAGFALALVGWVLRAELYKVAAIGGNGVVLCVLLSLPLVAAYFSLRGVWLLARKGWRRLAGIFLCFSLMFAGWVSVNVGAALVCDAEIDAALARLPPAGPSVVYIRRAVQEVPVYLPVDRSISVAELAASHANYAVPAVEDERLRSRWEGVIDLRALLRAARNILFFRRREGASTIVVQAAKWVRIKNRRQTFSSSPRDKISQWFLALRLSQRFPSPEEQLTLYLNLVEVDGTHGVAYAAVDFFGAPLPRLSVEQSALLAGLLNNPTEYHPRARPRAALARRNLVLDRMAENGLLPDARPLQAAPPGLAEPAAAAELVFYARAARKVNER